MPSRSNTKLTWVAPLALLPVAILGPNMPLAFYACLVLGIGTIFLWRPGEPPILLFIFLYQWIQVAVGLFYGNLFGLPIGSVSEYTGRDDMAVFLLLTGLLVLVLAVRLAVGPAIRDLVPRAQAFVATRPVKFWFSLFAASWIFSGACLWLGARVRGLEQPLFALAQVQWAAFMLLTLATFAIPGRSKVLWFASFAFEFAISIGGYFSSFRYVFIYALIGLIGSNVRLRARTLVFGMVLAGVLLFLGIVWTAIKGEYRVFVNGGTGQQVVLADYHDRVVTLVDLVSQLDEERLSRAAVQMVQRLAYFQLFGVVLNRVPSLLPYADGSIWGNAILRVFTPRFLFPNKSAINDSQLTNRYTGLKFASYQRGTSVSMSYMAESYIDFGPVFMFVPIAALGLFLGYIYRRLLLRPGSSAALGVAFVPFALMPALALETSVLKLVPALGLSAIASWLTLSVLAPRLFGLSGEGRTMRMSGLGRREGV